MNINPFIELIVLILDLYWWVLLFWVVISWLSAFGVINHFNPVVAKIADVLERLTDPVLRRIRRYMPNLGGVDISPVVVLLAIWFVKRILYTYFYRY